MSTIDLKMNEIKNVLSLSMQTRILPPAAASKKGMEKREEIEVDGGREVRSFRSMARPYLVYHVNFTDGIHMLFCHQLLSLPPFFRFTPEIDV